MGAPLIGMPFHAFVVLLIVSAIAAAIVHWGLRYRLFHGMDGYFGQWVVAWLGPAVLGHWFASAMVAHIYIIPAFIGALAGAFGGTLNAKVLAGVTSQRGMSL